MTGLTKAQILRGAKLILSRNGWFQDGFYDRAAELRGVPLADCPVCIEGAINLAAGASDPSDADAGEGARLWVHEALTRRGGLSLSGWQDVAGRTVGEVYALLDRAIGLAEAGAAA